MKKFMIFAAVFVVLVVLFVGIYLAITFFSLGSNSQSEQVTAASTESLSSDVLSYVAENYDEFTAKYDEGSNLLTLYKKTSFSLKSAPSIYTDTSTYLTQAQIFALDISAACAQPELTIVLCYLSKDEEPMLSISSNGTVTKHWE